MPTRAHVCEPFEQSGQMQVEFVARFEFFFSSVFEENELGSGVSTLLGSNGVSTHHKSMIYITIQR